MALDWLFDLPFSKDLVNFLQLSAPAAPPAVQPEVEPGIAGLKNYTVFRLSDLAWCFLRKRVNLEM